MVEKDMLQLLANAGLSTDILYYSHMPDEPVTMVCVKVTPGLNPSEVHSSPGCLPVQRSLPLHLFYNKHLPFFICSEKEKKDKRLLLK